MTELSKEWVLESINAGLLHNGLKPLPTEPMEVSEPTEPDISITKMEYDGKELLIWIHSRHANINPFHVLISQVGNGFVVRNAHDVAHPGSNQPLRVSARIFKDVAVQVTSEKNPLYSTEKIFNPSAVVVETPPVESIPKPSEEFPLNITKVTHVGEVLKIWIHSPHAALSPYFVAIRDLDGKILLEDQAPHYDAKEPLVVNTDTALTYGEYEVQVISIPKYQYVSNRVNFQVTDTENTTEVETIPEPSDDYPLEIRQIEYNKSSEGLSIEIHSPHAGLSPYRVSLADRENELLFESIVEHKSSAKPLVVGPIHASTVGLTVLVEVKSLSKPNYSDTVNFELSVSENTTEVESPNIPKWPVVIGDGGGVGTSKKKIVVPKLIYNCTGGGYEPTMDGSIHPDHWTRALKFQEVDAADIIRLNVPWQKWEPNEGEFTTIEMLQFLKRCKSYGFKVAFCLMPHRNDSLIPESERATDHLGRIWEFEGKRHTFALGAEASQAKFFNAVEKLHELLNTYAPNTEMTMMGMAETEEFYVPNIREWQTGVDGGDNLGMCIYSHADQQFYRSLYGEDIPVHYPESYPDNIGWLYSQKNSVLDYVTSRLAAIQNGYIKAVRSASKIPVTGFYADLAAKQSAWYGVRDLKAIFGNCDMLYSSDGGYYEKFMVADFHRGTFPTKPSIIEIDPQDAGVPWQKREEQINKELVKRIITECVERGVSYIAWAMSFFHGANGGHNQIGALGEAIADIRKNGIEVQEPETIHTIEVSRRALYSDANLYAEKWKALGGEEAPTPFESVM